MNMLYTSRLFAAELLVELERGLVQLEPAFDPVRLGHWATSKYFAYVGKMEEGLAEKMQTIQSSLWQPSKTHKGSDNKYLFMEAGPVKQHRIILMLKCREPCVWAPKTLVCANSLTEPVFLTPTGPLADLSKPDAVVHAKER